MPQRGCTLQAARSFLYLFPSNSLKFSGHEALSTWRDVTEVLEYACQHFEEKLLTPELREALVTFMAHSLEMEVSSGFKLCLPKGCLLCRSF